MRSILMLEPDDDDRYITQAVFDEHQYNIHLEFVTTSEDFFKYLDQCAAGKKQSPSLILLNYHIMPVQVSSVLQRLKRHADFAHIPVVVLSGSVKEEMIQECYLNGASSFIQKPVRAVDTNEKIENFFKYWFETVELL